MIRTMIVLVSTLLCFTGAACTDSADSPSGPVDPVYADAQLVRTLEKSDAEPYYPPGADNGCPTTDASYVTEASIVDVVTFYEDEGFKGKDEGAFEDGELMRWIGERGSDEDTYRRVDIATGEVAGRPESETAFTISKPNCPPAP